MTGDQLQALIGSYSGFFGALAGAAAAILALVLATFQLNLDKWRSDPLREPVALVTLAELAAPLFFSLLFLLPNTPWRAAGWLTGGLGYAMLALHLVQYLRHLKVAELFDHLQMWLGGAVSGFTFSVMFWSDSIESKAWVCVWFIFSGVSETWIFIPRIKSTSASASPTGVLPRP